MATLEFPSKAIADPTEPKFVVEENVIQHVLAIPLDHREAAARRWFSGCDPDERDARVAALLAQARNRELH